jgi:hypothetical protein
MSQPTEEPGIGSAIPLTMGDAPERVKIVHVRDRTWAGIDTL